MTTKPATDEPAPELSKQEIADIEAGRQAIREGRFVEHEAVAEWLRSWGTDRDLPPEVADRPET